MAALPERITVAQYRQMPDDDTFIHELHDGEVVRMSRPKKRHFELQRRFRKLLEPRLPSYEVEIEFAFRAIPEFELRSADVAAVRSERDAQTDPSDNLHGAPELVIEVKSPSNRAGKLQEYAQLCLAHGSVQFWIADDEDKTITVIGRDGSRRVYGVGETISLSAFGGDAMRVDEVFG